METLLGRIVYSKAGRDKGKAFVVVGVIDDNNVYLADGDIRKIEKPKKKKIKHLETTDYFSLDLIEKLKNKQKITNSEIKKALDVVQGHK